MQAWSIRQVPHLRGGRRARGLAVNLRYGLMALFGLILSLWVPATLAALLGFVAHNLLFVEPLYSLTVYHHSDLLTLLWVLEGSVNLTEGEGAPQQLAVDELAIVNRNRRWSLRSAGANAVMILTLSASWLARLDNAFFAVDYQITPRTRDADDGLRRLMRSARAVRTQNRVFGGLLMAVGAGLFFVKRGGQHA